MFDTHLGAAQQFMRPPARALSQWHLALALPADAISGVVRSKTGKVLVVKGDTHKEKNQHCEFSEREDGSIAETRILTSKFVPHHPRLGYGTGFPTLGRCLSFADNCLERFFCLLVIKSHLLKKQVVKRRLAPV